MGGRCSKVFVVRAELICTRASFLLENHFGQFDLSDFRPTHHRLPWPTDHRPMLTGRLLPASCRFAVFSKYCLLSKPNSNFYSRDTLLTVLFASFCMNQPVQHWIQGKLSNRGTRGLIKICRWCKRVGYRLLPFFWLAVISFFVRFLFAIQLNSNCNLNFATKSTVSFLLTTSNFEV